MVAPEVKRIGRLTPASKIEIWQPRWRDRTVLIAKHKVQLHNEVVFTQAPSMGTNSFYLSGEDIRSCLTDTNGKLACYAVPLDKLKLLERE